MITSVSTTRGGPASVASASPRRLPWVPTLLTYLPYLVFVAGWLVLTWGLRWYGNPDGVVYALMARRMAQGDFDDAVLAYWSPLYPALAAPFVALGLQEFLALRLVHLLAALATIPILRRLCLRAGASSMASGLATTAGALLLSAAVRGLYPDVLFMPLILGCLSLALAGASIPAGLLVGFLGGLAYLSKAVALPYVGALLAMVLVLKLISERGSARGTLRMIAGAVVALAVTAGPWVAVVSAETGQVAISAARGFNARLVAPGSWGNPMGYPRLYSLPEGAITPWERPADLTVFKDLPEGEAVPSTSNEGRFENTLAQAQVAAGSLLRRWTPVAVLAMVGMVAALRSPPRRRTAALGSLLAGAGFAAGMTLLIVIERYLWFPMLALLPAAALGLDAIARWLQPRIARSTGWFWVAHGAAALWLALIAACLAPIPFTLWNTDREVWLFADQIRQGEALSGSIAGASDWHRSQLLAFLVDVPYAGLIDPSAPPSETKAQLADVGAGAVVVWPGEEGEAGELPPGSPPLLERLER